MIHQLKVEPKFFDDIAHELKTFEVRMNDRDYQVGDFLALNELTHEIPATESGCCIFAVIKYILDDERVCKKDTIIMGIDVCEIRCRGNAMVTGNYREIGVLIYGERRKSLCQP